MNERNDRRESSSMERRQGAGATIWGELVVESAWRPSDKPRVESEGWLRSKGYLPERRQAR